MKKKEPKTKKPAKPGRPSKYKPEFCDIMVDMAEQGKSRVQCAVAIGVHRDTLYEWGEKHEAFSDALKKSRDLAESYWENKINEMMENGELVQTSPMMMFYMKCRFGWRDRDASQVNVNAQTQGPGETKFVFNTLPDSTFDPLKGNQ